MPEVLDKIHIRGLRLYCIVGIFPFERESKQEVLLNITLHANLSPACASDAIEDTVDYKKLKQRIMTMVESSSYYLIEKLAEAIADICLEERQVEHVDVSVDKPGALRYAESVAVEIRRSREKRR